MQGHELTSAEKWARSQLLPRLSCKAATWGGELSMELEARYIERGRYLAMLSQIAPVKLGALVRWNRAEIEIWISDGCPTVRAATGKGVRG